MTKEEDKRKNELLRAGKNAYIYNEFEEAVFKFMPSKE